LKIDLRGVRTIGVAVADSSEVHRLDASELAKAVVEEAKYGVRESRFRLRLDRDGGNEDAHLKIAILKESAVRVSRSTPGAAQTWAMRLNLAMALTARDGRMIRQDANWQVDVRTGIVAADEAEFLQKVYPGWVCYQLSSPLFRHTFYGELQ